MSRQYIVDFKQGSVDDLVPSVTLPAGTTPVNLFALTSRKQIYFPGLQRKVTFTSNETIDSIELTGIDCMNRPVTETLGGPTADTVESAAQYHRIDTITITGTIPADATLSMGSGDVGTSIWINFDINRDVWDANIHAIVANDGITYSVQYTNEPLTIIEGGQEVPNPDPASTPTITIYGTPGDAGATEIGPVTSFTQSACWSLPHSPVSYVRVTLDAGGTTGSLKFIVNQQGI